jgi:hypothetical protein
MANSLYHWIAGMFVFEGLFRMRKYVTVVHGGSATAGDQARHQRGYRVWAQAWALSCTHAR